LPRWIARVLRDWHRRKALRLSALAEKQRKELDALMERVAYHEHRVKHWDLISNRRDK
jgi:hypothetical protein